MVARLSHPRTWATLYPVRSGLLLLVQGMLWLALAPPSRGQYTPDSLLQASFESSVETSLDEQEAQLLTDVAADFLPDPVEINQASISELASLPGMTLPIATAIIDHRKDRGPFREMAALLQVNGMTTDLLRQVQPFLSCCAITDHYKLAFTQRLVRRLDLEEKYTSSSSPYLGSPEGIYTRLQISTHHVATNLTLEKDPGEAFLWNPSTETFGFDHVSAYLTYTNKFRDISLIAGDYSLAVGQGMVFWHPYRFGKGRELSRHVARPGSGLKASGSSEENRFFRGLAGSFRPVRWSSLTFLLSSRSLDASLADLSSQDSLIQPSLPIAGLQTSGYHRTLHERDQKDIQKETLVGGVWEGQLQSLSWAISGYRAAFLHPFLPGNFPHERFDLAGKQLSLGGLYLAYRTRAVTLFGEVARSFPGSAGGTGGFKMKSPGGVEVAVVGRSLPRDFQSLHGNPIRAGSGAVRNERGITATAQLTPLPKWFLSAYVDHYSQPWSSFSTPLPGRSTDSFFLVEYRPRKWLTTYLQLRNQQFEKRNTPQPDRDLLSLVITSRQSLRWHTRYAFSPQLQLQLRVEAVWEKVPGRQPAPGTMIYQDVHWQPLEALRINARWTIFDASSSRIYTFENDVAGLLSLPALTDVGERGFILVRANPIEKVSIQAKYAVTFKQDTDLTDGTKDRPVLRDVHFVFMLKP